MYCEAEINVLKKKGKRVKKIATFLLKNIWSNNKMNKGPNQKSVTRLPG